MIPATVPDEALIDAEMARDDRGRDEIIAAFMEGDDATVARLHACYYPEGNDA